jgi:hypothetical protein
MPYPEPPLRIGSGGDDSADAFPNRLFKERWIRLERNNN